MENTTNKAFYNVVGEAIYSTFDNKSTRHNMIKKTFIKGILEDLDISLESVNAQLEDGTIAKSDLGYPLMKGLSSVSESLWFDIQCGKYKISSDVASTLGIESLMQKRMDIGMESTGSTILGDAIGAMLSELSEKDIPEVEEISKQIVSLFKENQERDASVAMDESTEFQIDDKQDGVDGEQDDSENTEDQNQNTQQDDVFGNSSNSDEGGDETSSDFGIDEGGDSTPNEDTKNNDDPFGASDNNSQPQTQNMNQNSDDPFGGSGDSNPEQKKEGNDPFGNNNDSTSSDSSSPFGEDGSKDPFGNESFVYGLESMSKEFKSSEARIASKKIEQQLNKLDGTGGKSSHTILHTVANLIVDIVKISFYSGISLIGFIDTLRMWIATLILRIVSKVERLLFITLVKEALADDINRMERELRKALNSSDKKKISNLESRLKYYTGVLGFISDYDEFIVEQHAKGIDKPIFGTESINLMHNSKCKNINEMIITVPSVHGRQLETKKTIRPFIGLENQDIVNYVLCATEEMYNEDLRKLYNEEGGTGARYLNKVKEFKEMNVIGVESLIEVITFANMFGIKVDNDRIKFAYIRK